MAKKLEDRNYMDEWEKLTELIENISRNFGYFEGIYKEKSSNTNLDLQLVKKCHLAFESHGVGISTNAIARRIILDVHSLVHANSSYDTVCIPQFIKLLRYNEFDTQELNKLEHDIKKIKGKQEIKDYRDKVIAHTDIDVLESTVVVGVIDEAIRTLIRVYEKICKIIDEPPVDFYAIRSEEEHRGKIMIIVLSHSIKGTL